MSTPTIPWTDVKSGHTYEIQQVTSTDPKTQTRCGQPFVRVIGGGAGISPSFTSGSQFETREKDWQGKAYIMRRLCFNYLVLRELIPEGAFK